MIEQKLSTHTKHDEQYSKEELCIDGMTCKCCPVFNTFNIIGKKFTPLLIRNMLFLKHKRFGEFLNIEGMNPKTLSIRLKEMEKDGLIKREVYNETPIRIEYYLTEKGMALQPILEQMALFSMKYCYEQVFENPDPIKINKINTKSLKKYTVS
ncbi:MAG: winged helix-turn-helix transcriptional regulator [Nitrososphaeraceae archaeon]